MKSILGIGNALTDILAVLPDDTLLETYGLEEFSDLLSKKSSFMQELANIDLYDEDLLRAQGLAPSAAIEISTLLILYPFSLTRR